VSETGDVIGKSQVFISEEIKVSETDTESKISSEKDILLFRRRSKNCEASTRETSPENYDYLVTLRKVMPRPVSATMTNLSRNQVGEGVATTEESRQSSVKSSLNEINLDEEFFNETKIKEVVEHCFEELTRNKKISNNHMFLKGKTF
jgi:hypothetical protein